MKTIRTTCPYCGVGCGVLASVDDAGQVSVRGDDQHPANLGRLCVKGAALGETTGLAGRLLTPEVDGQQVAWPQALAETAARLRQIIDQHGPQAVAFYASGQLLTEDYYAANKLDERVYRRGEHRYQFTAVHVVSGHWLQAGLWRRRGALQLR